MSFNYKNQEIEDWIFKHQANVEKESEKTKEIELVANVWHIDDDNDKEENETEHIEESK